MKPIRILKNLFESNQSASSLLSFVARSQAYQLFINQKIKHYQNYIKKTKKYNIIIETSNLCNASCIMCPHRIMTRKHQLMSTSTFNLIIKRLHQDHIHPLSFILNGFGEPLTDSKIINRISKIKQNFPTSIVKIYTNLSLLLPSKIKPLLQSGLDEINVSFNGYNQKSYQAIMGLDYQNSLKNLKKLIKLKKTERPNLKIRISMALVHHNDNQEKNFINTWAPLVDSVSINKVHTYNQSINSTAGKHKISPHQVLFPCKYLFNTIVIGVTGQIFLCCLDYNGQYHFGNIKHHKILKMFYSKKFQKIRHMHLTHKIKSIPICSTCYTPTKNGVEWLIRDLY